MLSVLAAASVGDHASPLLVHIYSSGCLTSCLTRVMLSSVNWALTCDFSHRQMRAYRNAKVLEIEQDALASGTLLQSEEISIG